MFPAGYTHQNSLPKRSVSSRTISDYSPFGVLLKERTVESEFFRLGFQGQEHDDEVKGEGNSVNFKYRMHDPRIGRFFAVDLLGWKYSYQSPYTFSENSTISFIELEGLEKVGYQSKKNGMYGDISWHDYSGDSEGHIEKALTWVENYHQGNLDAERISKWQAHWYVTVTDMRDEYGRSVGTSIAFYKNRNDWKAGKAFKYDYIKDISQRFFALGDGSGLEGGHDPAAQGGWGG